MRDAISNVNKLIQLALPNATNLPDACEFHWEGGKCTAQCTRLMRFVVDVVGKHCGYENGYHMNETCHTGACPHPASPFGSEGHDDSHAVQEGALKLQLPYFVCIVTALALGEVLHHVPVFRRLPESAVIVAVSAVGGLALHSLTGEGGWEVQHLRPISAPMMNLVLLPIIIFTSGWTVSMKSLYKNFRYIIIFAVLGTLLSSASIAGMIVLTSHWGWHSITSPRVAVAIAVIVSATDPVATLATFAKKKVEPILNILVFGESILNDAVAIVLFGIINLDEPDNYFAVDWHQSVLRQVASLLIGSMLVGFAVAFIMVGLYRVLLRLAQLHTAFNCIYILSAAYISNSVAEAVHFSGIISCLFAGGMMALYMYPLMSDEDFTRAGQHLQLLAELGDITVFVMVGIATGFMTSMAGVGFGIFLFLFCLVGRAVSVVPSALLSSCMSTCVADTPICTIKRTIMMWHAGLRGGVALTLVMQLKAWAKEFSTDLEIATLIVIVGGLVLMGSTTDFMLERLQIETGVEPESFSYVDFHMKYAHFHQTDSWRTKLKKGGFMLLHTILVGEHAVLEKQAQSRHSVSTLMAGVDGGALAGKDGEGENQAEGGERRQGGEGEGAQGTENDDISLGRGA